MNIDRNYNSQFIQIDFDLLDDPAFLTFANRAEFATYLILRRFIWRGGGHRLGLSSLYAKDRKLASSVSAGKLAALLGLRDVTRVSKHLSYLVEIGVVERIRTGRERIFILGEWYKPPGWDVSKEFYYLDNRFGVNKSDLAKTAKSELHPEPNETWLKKPNSNREVNREKNTVKNGVKYLPDLAGIEAGERAYIAQQILDHLKDEHSKRFYELVAAKIPAGVIRSALAEIKADGAANPAKVFTFRMNQYAIRRLRQAIGERAAL